MIATADWIGISALVTAIGTAIATVVSAIASARANRTSGEAKVTAESAKRQTENLQTQVTTVALNTPPAPILPSLPLNQINQGAGDGKQ